MPEHGSFYANNASKISLEPMGIHQQETIDRRRHALGAEESDPYETPDDP
jgi:hypothetical protein